MTSYKNVLATCLFFFPAHYIKACVTTDATFVECALQHGNEAIPYIVKGNNLTQVNLRVYVRITA